ncbi:MAG: hybrid sensor histidine kinase/response regulator [Oscillatoriales cyanobacterium SM2_1_8]|nr:hybrid sensor histidine kinase/response regulator [Oscillatoriales cyanobacterium SM2_1_8]
MLPASPEHPDLKPAKAIAADLLAVGPVGAESERPILIVDDNPTNLKVLSKTLTSAGFEVAVANNGTTALKLAAYDPPALILLDVMMPGIDGFKTCERLKEEEITQDIPVIFMTALSETAAKVRGLSLGAVDYITKPFEEEEVLARVRLHMRLNTLARALETQNQQLVKTLADLQAAQKQIVAQEKLASLGTLTAGVAHELRNPLNFVNNFAAGSMDMAQELQELLQAYQAQPQPGLWADVTAVVQELAENARSIHEHGQRAESIIQSMMQHARTDGGGQAQPVELNALIEQSVQLAYHSRRAKDSSFNVAFVRQYDPGVGLVELVIGDFTRAIINLADNACYALGLKQVSLGETFQPQLTLITRDRGQAVEVVIRDNGSGISTEALEKIFTPFFTTKPAGEGTGLGLSLTHDILVGQHRGNLNVATALGEYTEFTLILPKQFTDQSVLQSV